MSYTVKKLESEEFDVLIPLMKDSFGVHVGIEYFRWKYLQSPSGSFIGYIAIAPDGEVAAYYGVIPELYSINGLSKIIYQSCDTMTHSRHRRKGLFNLLASHCYDYLKKENKLFVIGFGGGQSTPGFIKMGWRHLFSIHTYFTHRLFLSFYVSMKQLTANPKGKTEKIQDLSQIEKLLYESCSSANIHSVKSHNIYRWRIANPLHTYQFFTYTGTGNHPEGFIVVYIKDQRLHLFDFYAQSREAATGLFKLAVQIMKENKLHYILTFTNPSSGFREAVSRFGFIQNPFTIGPLNKGTRIPFIALTTSENSPELSQQSWHINMFEHDAV